MKPFTIAIPPKFTVFNPDLEDAALAVKTITIEPPESDTLIEDITKQVMDYVQNTGRAPTDLIIGYDLYERLAFAMSHYHWMDSIAFPNVFHTCGYSLNIHLIPQEMIMLCGDPLQDYIYRKQEELYGDS